MRNISVLVVFSRRDISRGDRVKIAVGVFNRAAEFVHQGGFEQLSWAVLQPELGDDLALGVLNWSCNL